MLKFLVLSLICVQLAQSTSFEQTRDCLHGPEFWCQSVQNARKCGAFKHCLDTVWKMHNKYMLNDQNDHSCDTCLECLHGDTERCPNIDVNLDEISDLFMAGIPSMTTCKLINACNNNQQQQPIRKPDPKNNANLNDCLKLHPRTWCDSIENARTCNSIEYCRENIWSKLRPMVLAEKYEKTDAVCGFCIWTFNKLHEVLQNNLTEFSVEQYLLGACSLIPNKDDESKCTDTINKNFPEVYNLVRNSMDPGIICRVIKLCKDDHLTETPIFDNGKMSVKILNVNIDDVIVTSPLQKQQQQDKPNMLDYKTEMLVPKLGKTNGVACEVCSMVLTAAKFLIENDKDEQEVLGFIGKELCGRLGSLNATCVEYLNTAGKEILDALVKNIDPSLICNRMGLCLQNQVTSESTKRFFDINVKSDSNCTLCKLVMTEVKTMLDNKKSEDQILDFIRKNLCEKSAQYVDMCKTVVTAYGPLILEFLSHDINPSQICQLVGMCPKQTMPQPTDGDTPSCALCEFVLTTLSNFITQNSSSAEVEKWLEYVCEALPSTIRAECKAFVDEYEPVIVALLSNQIQPQKICQFIGLCKKSTDFRVENFEEIKDSFKRIQVSRIEDNKPGCAICEFVLNVLSKYITQNSTAPEVEKWLEYVCKNVMPSTIKQECADFVQEYGPIIIQLLATQVQPQKICTIIKVCTGTQSQSQSAPLQSIPLTQTQKVQNTSPLYCDACQLTLQFLEYELNKDKSKEAVTKALGNVCKVAPTNLRDNCNSIVETYGYYLIDLLNKYTEPLAVCYRIKLCQQKVESIETPVQTVKLNQPKPVPSPVVNQQTKNDRLKVDITNKVGDVKCSLCIYVAEAIDGLLKQNKTDQEIKDALEKVCNFFPGPLKDQCLSFMDEYAVYVLELLASDLDPQEACEKLKLCAANNQVSHVDFRSLLKAFRDNVTNRRN